MSRRVPLCASPALLAKYNITNRRGRGQLVLSATTRCRFAPCPILARPGPYYGGTAPRPAGTVPYYACMSMYGIAPTCVHGHCLRILVARASFPFLPGADGLAADAEYFASVPGT